jgi:hypothetical protein
MTRAPAPAAESPRHRVVIDILDEDAFRARSGKDMRIFVGQADDPPVGGRDTSAAFVLDPIEEVERFLDTLAR